MSLLTKAKMFAQMSQNARADGDTAASLELAIHAARLLQLVRILDRATPEWQSIAEVAKEVGTAEELLKDLGELG